MQCTSYIPVYYHARDLNAGASVFSWHPFDGNNTCGEERGYNIALPPNNMDQYLGYDKEVVKQMIQNHEATFRYQVQELHRLYTRQRELMDEMRVREIFAQHLLSQTSESIHSLSHARPEFSSHATTWLVGDLSHNIQRPLNFVAENSYNDVKFQSNGSKRNEKQVLDLELPADMYYDDQWLQFKDGTLSQARMKISDFHSASDSDIDSVKTGDSPCLNLSGRRRNCFIDLNEAVLLESLPYSGPSETCTNHMEIDLNSMPVSCFSETEIAPDNLQSVNKESCAYDHAMKNEECVEDHPFVGSDINKFLKTEIEIDLNSGIEDERSPHLSSGAVLQIESEEDTVLVGPVSPENEECSPPRGTSEDMRVETPLLSEGEPSAELETIAAQTLVTILSFGVQEYDSKETLYWFAEIVSSTGDDLQNNIMKHKNDDFGALTLKSEENALNLCHGKKEKEMGALSGKGRSRGSKQIEKPFKRKTGRKSCAKPRKYSKLSSSSSDEIKKSISTILKQPATLSKQGVLQSWGKIRKRQGGRRRRATKFLVSL